MEMMSFAPEEFFGDPNWCAQIHTGKVDFPQLPDYWGLLEVQCTVAWCG